MPDIQPGTYKARIEAILPATYRDRNLRRLVEGYFISFKVDYQGTFSEVVTANTHHKGLLARTIGPLMKDMGLPIASFNGIKDGLIGQAVGLLVKEGRRGKEFQLMACKDTPKAKPINIDAVMKPFDVAELREWTPDQFELVQGGGE